MRAALPILLLGIVFFLPIDVSADPAVAVIDTKSGPISISLSRLNAYLGANPGTSAAAGLDQLIEFELLADRARQAGLADSSGPEIAGAKRMVALYLKESFEPLWTRATIPEELLRTSYERNRRIFNHPELRQAVHIIVTQDSKFPEDTTLAGQAKAIADRIFADFAARAPKDLAEFEGRSKPMSDWGKAAGLQVQFQNLHRFARRGRYSVNFTDKVFATTADKSVLPVFKTEFGYHIVWVEKVIPARSDDLETVREELRDKITPEVRSMKLIALTDQLSEQYPPINRGTGARRLMNPAPLVVLELGESK